VLRGAFLVLCCASLLLIGNEQAAPANTLRFAVAVVLAAGVSYFSGWHFDEILFLKLKLQPEKASESQN